MRKTRKMRNRNQQNTFSIINKTNGRPPRLPFLEIKNAVLGKKYELSVVVIGDKLSQKINNQYRKKNNPTNVLCFPLQKYAGELFINTARARHEARMYKKKYNAYVGMLFIHGLLHLKGRRHSSTMETEERKVREKFSINM